MTKETYKKVEQAIPYFAKGDFREPVQPMEAIVRGRDILRNRKIEPLDRRKSYTQPCGEHLEVELATKDGSGGVSQNIELLARLHSQNFPRGTKVIVDTAIVGRGLCGNSYIRAYLLNGRVISDLAPGIVYERRSNVYKFRGQ